MTKKKLNTKKLCRKRITINKTKTQTNKNAKIQNDKNTKQQQKQNA